MWKPPGRSSGNYSYKTLGHMCMALYCRGSCSMPVKLRCWPSQTFSVCSVSALAVQRQGHDHTDLQYQAWGCSHSKSYCQSLSSRALTSFWERGFVGLDMWRVLVSSQYSMWYTGWWQAWARKAQDDNEEIDGQLTWMEAWDSRLPRKEHLAPRL